MESIYPRKSDFLPLKDRLAVLSLARLVVVGAGVAILSILSGGGDGEGGGGGGLGCSIPPTETEVGGGRLDEEEDGCLVSEGAVDRVLGVVLKRPAELRGCLDMLD